MQDISKVQRKLIKLQTIDSTHLFALRLLEINAISDDVTILAKMQTAGIGRCGRLWNSRCNNLFMSKIKKITNKDSRLSLIIACAVHEAIDKLLLNNDELKIHWPNDIYFGSKKLSGILISAINDWFVISIGVNIFSVPELDTAISLKEIYPELNIDAIQLLHQIEGSIEQWLLVDFSCVRDYWMNHAKNLGQLITIKNGENELSGIFQGIDDAGKLMLAVDDKTTLISSGDVFESVNKIKMRMV